jgi:hypothetical protein
MFFIAFIIQSKQDCSYPIHWAVFSSINRATTFFFLYLPDPLGGFELDESSNYNGMFPCFFGGRDSLLFDSMDRARINLGLVLFGSITSSM